MERLAHIPVMLEECMEGLNLKDNGIYFDGTLGGGGHSYEILRRTSAGRLVATDLDTESIARAKEKLAEFEGRFAIAHDNYKNFKYVLKENGIEAVDGILLDFGVSSFQLDDKSRGFSYNADCALDMRMNQSDGFTAYDVVNSYDAEGLRDIITRYGEERWASRIADFIVKARKDKPIETTTELVDIIKAAIPASARRDGPHPAKRTFQAIRIEVNDELGQLEKAIDAFCDVLAPGGRLCVITFHSLEDRIVKEIIARRVHPCTCPKEFPVCVCGKKPDISKKSGKPILPTPEEIERNPRARSAKLRICEKLGQAAR